MSVNFGYGGYGMMNGMNTAMGINGATNNSQGFTNQYNCPACYQNGPIPYNLKTNVDPLPYYSLHESWLGRLVRKITGG